MKKIIIFALFLLIPSLCLALTADEIVTKSDQAMRGDSSIATMSMTIKTPDWERTLKFKGWEKGRDKMFIKVTYPEKEAGTASLKIGNDMWNYLPKVNRTIKIPPSMMLQSWMGSDFTNDDLVKESSVINDYTHTLLGTEKINGDDCYKLKLTPKPDAAVVWGKIIYYCRVADFVPVREEFYSDKGEMIKLLEMSQIKYMHDRNYPTYWVMKTLNKPDRYTAITVKDIQFNVNVPNSKFLLQNIGK